MKNAKFLITISFASALLLGNLSFAQEIKLIKPAVVKKTVNHNNKITQNVLSIQKGPDDVQKLIDLQKQKDMDDLEALWNAAIEKNTVIKFAINKLSIPPEQRRYHSSLMARSVSSLISGASMLPAIFGVDRYAACAANTSGSLVGRYIKSKGAPKDINLTDTELIQLASMIQSLQDDLIKNYYDYKASLTALMECREKLMLYHKNYSRALQNNELMSSVIESAMYDKQKMQEYQLKQEVKVHLLALERLAGEDTVNNLNLSRYAWDEPVVKNAAQFKKYSAQRHQNDEKKSATIASNKRGGANNDK